MPAPLPCSSPRVTRSWSVRRAWANCATGWCAPTCSASRASWSSRRPDKPASLLDLRPQARAVLRSGQFRADNGRAIAERLELRKGSLARHVLHAAIRSRDEALRRDVLQPLADARRHRLGALDLARAEIEHPEDHRFAPKVLENAEVELRLRGLDRDLLRTAVSEFRQEGVAARLARDEMRIAEAEVHRSLGLELCERPVDRLHGIAARSLGVAPEPRLVNLDDVGAGSCKVPRLLVDGDGDVHRHLLVVGVELVAALLGNREGARQGDLDSPVRVAAQEFHITDLDRVAAADLSDDPRQDALAAVLQRDPDRVVDVDPLQRGGKAVGVALAPDLAVADDVDPSTLHVADCNEGSVVLGLLEHVRRHPPDLLEPHPRHGQRLQLFAVDKPSRLRVASDHRRRQDGCWHRDLPPHDNFVKPYLRDGGATVTPTRPQPVTRDSKAGVGTPSRSGTQASGKSCTIVAPSARIRSRKAGKVSIMGAR